MERSLSVLQAPEERSKLRLWLGQEIQGVDFPAGFELHEPLLLVSVPSGNSVGVRGGEGGSAGVSWPTRPSERTKARLCGHICCVAK